VSHITELLILVAANFPSVGVKMLVVLTGHFVWQLGRIRWQLVFM